MTRIYLLELIRFFFIVLLTFQTLLGSFVQRTSAQQPPLFFIRLRSRCFASAKVLLFPFRATLSRKFFNYFSTFRIRAANQRLGKENPRAYPVSDRKKTALSRIFREFSAPDEGKISQNKGFWRKDDMDLTRFRGSWSAGVPESRDS